MDKLLAMSILSFGPSATFWMGPPTKRMSLDGEKQEMRKEDDEVSSGGEENRPAAKARGRGGEGGSSPWFAPEFDGLNVFETFVSH